MDSNTMNIVEGRIRHGLPMLGSCWTAAAVAQVSLGHTGHGFGSAGGFDDRTAVEPTYPTPSGRPGSPPV